jgi:hypothetical protein
MDENTVPSPSMPPAPRTGPPTPEAYGRMPLRGGDNKTHVIIDVLGYLT